MNNSKNLHQKFVSLNFEIIGMKNQLIALLLEIYEKGIYKQHGCSTIYEYAFRYAKLSKETVQLALRTLKNTEDKPLLRAKIETQGIYKVASVAKLATAETDKFYAEHVENMSKPALFEFAKEVRHGGGNGPDSDNNNGTQCGAFVGKMIIELDEETQGLFNRLKKNLAQNDSNKEALKIILRACCATFVGEQGHGKNVPGNVSSKISQVNVPKKFEESISKTSEIGAKTGESVAKLPSLPSRTINVRKRLEIQRKTNGKCAYPHCTKPIENFHHTIPFEFHRSHDNVVGLCKIHHEFCHNGVVKNELKNPENWKLNLKPHKSI